MTPTMIGEGQPLCTCGVTGEHQLFVHDRIIREQAAQPAGPVAIRTVLALALDAMGVEGRHDRMAADLLTTLSVGGFAVIRTAP
jgi:hypothetical protein